MQNKEWGINILRFFGLLLIQVLLLNNINFLGYINPYVYIIYIMLFPFTGNRTLLIFSSFLIGFCIDIFSDSGGIHAAASVLLAYARPLFLKISFGVSYLHNTVKLNEARINQLITYTVLCVLTHHFMLFLLEIFSTQHLLLVLKSTLFSGIFSMLIILSSFLLFGKRN